MDEGVGNLLHIPIFSGTNFCPETGYPDWYAISDDD